MKQISDVSDWLAEHTESPMWYTWSYYHVDGRRMLSYGFKTKKKRIQIAKFVDYENSDVVLNHSDIEPSDPFAETGIGDDPWFDWFFASGRPHHPASKSTADSSDQSAASTI